LAVELTNDLRTPMLVDESEFLGQTDLIQPVISVCLPNVY
jgi:hypothetical protein